MIPKPNVQKERAAKKRERSKRRSAFHDAVIAASGGRCENRMCMSVYTHRVDKLHAHHILHRSQGGDDDVNNGIALCPICHHKCHNWSYTYAGEKQSHTEFILGVLKTNEGRATWRWGQAYDYLQRRKK